MTHPETPLLRDVIDIPERAGADDYVLRLTEGVGRDRMAATLRDYVVTDALADAFEAALDRVAASLRDGSSRASYLSGSFGSGKSHFMAVLYALLGHDPAARGKPELAPVVAAHDATLQDKRILRLAFHFLDSESLEQTVLGGYVTQVRYLHPDAPLPAVHRADALLADAERLRAQMGEDAFLATLNESGGSAGADAVWAGVLGGTGTWTSATYDAARAAGPGTEDRQRLVSALVKAYFNAFTKGAEFVSLDEGLAAISAHAKSLGYDAIVLFLDELVLWLAFRVRDREFFGREAQKLTKFVEATAGDRAIPLVTFVARQLDLRKYFVDTGGGMGAEQQALDQAFQHQAGRFRAIVLGDDNLPYVAERRLLAPRDEAARRVLDAAFDRLDKRPEVWDVLLDGVHTDEQHRGADQAAFRRTYPFSPALVSTLRTLASAMQRDRTALKVMQQLLVDQRDSLTVADVIPVGDVFDLVVEGNEAVTEEMQGRFRHARKLYAEKLRPLLLREHGLDESAAAALPPGHAFRADDRLVKTLVLSAVAPEVPALKELTAGRLAALNHGSIVTPVPGQESSLVLAKVRRWSAEVPEIRVTSDPRDPVVRVQISEVDYESVVERAKGEDTDGQRRQTLKRLVWEAMGLAEIEGDTFGVSRQIRIWRGSRREVEVVYGNIRDPGYLPDEAFRATGDTWRFVLDYPFDEQGGSVRDDLARLDRLAAGSVSRTVAWVPHFLSAERRRDLGRLVILDWLFGGTGDRWRDHAHHLADVDRVQARSILEAQRDSLRERMRRTVQEAYGAATPNPANLDLDGAHQSVLVSLDPEFQPQAPVGHDLAVAFGNLVDQAYATTYPGHPRFEPEQVEVRPRDLTAVLDVVERAAQESDQRVFVEPPRRADIRRVANTLGVGHMGETHFQFDSDRFRFSSPLARAMGVAGVGPADPVTVRALREWIRALQPPAGLRPQVEDLVISAWAVLQQRAWYHYGAAIPTPRPGSVADDVELRPEALPAEDDWVAAVTRAGLMFGVHAPAYRSAAAVAQLAAGVREHAGRLQASTGPLVDAVTTAYARLGMATEPATGRLATATAGAQLVTAVRAAGTPVALVEALAHAPLPGTDQAAGRSLSQAAAVATQLSGFAWDRLRPLLEAESGTSTASREAKAVLDRLRAALDADELAQPLGPALERAEDGVFAWALAVAPASPVAPSPAPAEPAPGPVPARQPAVRRTLRTAADLEQTVARLREYVAEHAEEAVVVEWRVDR